MITIHQALQAATQTLAATSSTPRLDAEILLAHVLQTQRAYVLAERERELQANEADQFQLLVQRRVALEPVAYIVGHKEFYGLDFVVDPRVLVPRPETEHLIDLALAWTARRQAYTHTLSIADIGTGSGCIAVTLAVKLSPAQVYAVDLSADALAVARTNAARHGVLDQVMLLQGDGCTSLPHAVDLIVSNPPYTVLDEVDQNVRCWEPHLALDGGNDRGFAAVVRLMQQMPCYLLAHGAAMLEIGAWQGRQALEAAHRIFPDATISLHQDLTGHDRNIVIET